MHFRERGQVVQVIRTTYESGTKKGKNQIVGRLVKANPQLSDELKKELSTEERKEVSAWIEGYGGVVKLKKEFAARTLQEQMGLAEEWFSNQKSDDARALAAGLLPSWVRLRTIMKRNGLIE